MKSAVKAIALGIAAATLAAPAFAYTLSGTIPSSNKPVAIDLHKPFPSQYHHVRLTLKTAAKSAGIGYEVEFCVGPAGSPCPVPIRFPGGQQIIVSYGTGDLSTATLTLKQATTAAAPYSVAVDYSE